jgi:hypothetical protein
MATIGKTIAWHLYRDRSLEESMTHECRMKLARPSHARPDSLSDRVAGLLWAHSDFVGPRYRRAIRGHHRDSTSHSHLAALVSCSRRRVALELEQITSTLQRTALQPPVAKNLSMSRFMSRGAAATT